MHNILLVLTPCPNQFVFSPKISPYAYVSTKCHKGVPPYRLYKGLRKKIALDFSLLIILNSDIHTGTAQKTDNGLLFLMLLAFNNNNISFEIEDLNVQTETSTMQAWLSLAAQCSSLTIMHTATHGNFTPLLQPR